MTQKNPWAGADCYGLKVMADELASDCHDAHISDSPAATATYSNVSAVWDKLGDDSEALDMFKAHMLVPALKKRFTSDKNVRLEPTLVYDDRNDSLHCQIKIPAMK